MRGKLIMKDNTEYQEVEVRFGLEFFHNLDDATKEDIKELSERYARDQGFDHYFEYFWLKFTADAWFMLNCTRPDIVNHFRKAN